VILKIQLLDHHLLRLQQIPRKMQYNVQSVDQDNLPIQGAALSDVSVHALFLQGHQCACITKSTQSSLGKATYLM